MEPGYFFLRFSGKPLYFLSSRNQSTTNFPVRSNPAPDRENLLDT